MHKNNIKRFLSFLMVLILLIGPCSNLFSIGAAALDAIAPSNSGRLALKLTWWDDSTDVEHPSWDDSKGMRLSRAKLAAVGDASVSTTVVLSTVELSAQTYNGNNNGREYNHKTQTFTIRGGESLAFDVEVWDQKKIINDKGEYANEGVPVVRLNNSSVYTRQFGVTILSHGENAYIDGQRTIRSYVQGKTYFEASANKSNSYYAGNFLKNEGYTFKGAYEIHNLTTFSSVMQRNGSAPSKDGSAYIVNDTANTVSESDNKNIIDFEFAKEPYDFLHEKGEAKKLMDYLTGWQVYVSGQLTMKLHNGTGDLNRGDFEYQLKVDNSLRFIDRIGPGWSKDKWYNYIWKFDTNDTNTNTYPDKSESLTRGAYSRGTPVKNGQEVTLMVQNHEPTYKKKVKDIQLATYMVDQSAPYIKNIYVSQYQPSFKNGDEVYVMVQMSEPVQIHNIVTSGADPFCIRAAFYDSKTANTGSYMNFIYVDGNYTDVLIFKTTINGGTVYGDQLKISQMQGPSTIADLFMNKLGENNKAKWDIPEHCKTVSCVVDARVPTIKMNGNMPTEPAQRHEVSITVGNMASNGTLQYSWSKNRDINKVTGKNSGETEWKTATLNNMNATIVGEKLNGDYYLHLKAISPSGAIKYLTLKLGDAEKDDKLFRFDNTPPQISHDTASDVDYGKYFESHDIKLYITDPQTDAVNTYSEIVNVYYFVKKGNTLTTDQKVHVYGKDSSGAMKLTDGAFTMQLDHTMAGVDPNTYGTYTVYFLAEDQAGNITPNDKAYTLTMHFDNRPRFALEYSAYYTTEQPDGGASYRVPDEYAMDGLDIYYNTRTEGGVGELLKIKVLGEGEGVSAVESYEIDTIERDGVSIYANGNWSSGDTDALGFSSTQLPQFIPRADGRMEALLTFSPEAAGRYDIIFRKEGGRPSQILTIYVTPEDGAPANYKALYDEERLLINRVWQFSTAQFYSKKNSVGVYYDTKNGAKPIFSDREKALEYAMFMELGDVEILYLDDSDRSDTIVEYLNDPGFSSVYKRATDEDPMAQNDQTWIRYKSQAWTPNDKLTDGYWVYYYYRDGNATQINIQSLDELSNVNSHFAKALRNNAEEIADYNGKWLYLTQNGDSSHTDSYGQPQYSKTAIFYNEIRSDVAFPGIYANVVTYTGDSDIYDGFTEYGVEEQTLRIPLVANYSFAAGDYNKIYYRALGTTEWLPIQKGNTLRDTMQVSGVYELKEIGGGYRHYYIYCDFDAPRLHYTAIRQEGDVTSEAKRYFSQDFGGQSFQAKSMILKFFIDPEHAIAGDTVELDPYSYMYLSYSTMGGIMEEVATFMTLEDLKAALTNADGGFRVPNGVFRLYVYDRLGNGYVMMLKVNDTALIIKEPEVIADTSVTFYVNRDKSEIASFSVTRTGVSGYDVDESYASTKTYLKSGSYTMTVVDVYGNREVRTVSLERKLPTVSFWYKSGANYLPMTPTEDSTAIPTGVSGVFKQDNVYIITASSDVRISYGLTSKYAFTVTPADQTPYKESSTVTYHYIDIAITSVRWTIDLYYKEDPETKITITCINDFEPPTVTLKANVPEYDLYEISGFGNVLFQPFEGYREITLPGGKKANAKDVTFLWDDGADGSGVESVTYTLDGGEVHTVDPTATGLWVNTPGHYVVRVTDRLGNTTEFTFTLSKTLDFSAALSDGTPLIYAEDPTEHIEGSNAEAIYKETSYTGLGFELLLKEDLQLTYLYEADGKKAIYEILLREKTLTFAIFDSYGNLTVKKTVNLATDPPSGECKDFEHPVSYSYSKNGLKLSFPQNALPLEKWQFRINDLSLSVAYILQIERSNRAPALQAVKADSRESFTVAAEGFTGINEGFSFYADANELADLVSIVAYRSSKHTTDFSNIAPGNIHNLFVAGLIGIAEEEGYYKIIITNKYGNTQEFLLRVNFGADIDVVMAYADRSLASREHIITQSGEHFFYANRNMVVRIWNTEATVTVLYNGSAYNPAVRVGNGCIEMSFDSFGLYTVTVKDDCGNTFVLQLQLQAPDMLEYGDYLTGFNEEAVMRAEQYTNAPLSLSQASMNADYIAYVAFSEADKNTWSVLYDLLSQQRIDAPALLTDCIGKTDGSYDVLFADRWGNTYKTHVHISKAAQLFISRNTKNSAGNMNYSVEDAMANGIWSNFIVRFKNSAASYRLTVDGKEVKFNAQNEYICELPYTLGDTASSEHTVVYIDNYGNKYTFTVHLVRKTPTIQIGTKGDTVIRNNTTYVKGDFDYTWTDNTVTVNYTKDGGGLLGYQKGSAITVDGSYVFTFTDIAGNIETRRIQRDTAVRFELVYGNTPVESGIAVSSQIRINESGEDITIVKVLKDGKEYAVTGRIFRDHGSYSVTLSDPVGNTATVFFDIFAKATKSFTYTSRGNYALYQVKREIEGAMEICNGIMLNEEGQQTFTFFEDGVYHVELLHVPTNSYTTCRIEIDNVAPGVTLVGDISDDGITRSDITFSGLTRGDVIEIWRDGTLSQALTVSSAGESPTINEAGDYRVVIKDPAGNETAYEFTREYTTNTAANILICLSLLGIAVGGAFILYNRGRVRIS